MGKALLASTPKSARLDERRYDLHTPIAIKSSAFSGGSGKREALPCAMVEQRYLF